MILFDNYIAYDDMVNDFFNINYEHYDMPVAKLLQSLINMTMLFILIVLIHMTLMLLSICTKGPGKFKAFVDSRLRQFRFNVYIRLYMLSYFDLTFFSAMKILEGNNDTTMRKIAVSFSYVFFFVSVIAPVCFVVLLLYKFPYLKMKEMKASFNTLVLKIDKAGKWRVVNIAFFFGRRLITAMLLCLPVTNKYIFLQYVFILMTSHIYILYMVAVKPYQTPMMNAYVLANETFYSALIILIFIFSDATPQLNIKVVAGYCLIGAIFLLVIANIAYIIYNVKKGRASLKENVKRSKEKREEEERRRKEEEELRKKKEFDRKNTI